MTASAERQVPAQAHHHRAGEARRRRVGAAAVAWILVGLAGSLLLTLAGSRLGGGSVTWWFHPRLGPDRELERVFFYLGVALLILAWLGLGRLAKAPALAPAHIWLAVAMWSAPLALGAPLFSRDIYSYLAQGTMAHLGLSPYHAAPSVLAHYGHRQVLDAVDPFWRNATAPYGPLFVGVISLIVGVTGSHLVAGALLTRAFDLIGLVLLAICVPRLARSAGTDPTRASWLAVASPLILLQLVAPAHNDLLMAGLIAAGVTLAIERHPLLGIAVCALAATVKLPAIVAVPFITLVWARGEPRRGAQLRRLAQGAAVAVAVLLLVTLITGFGTGWVSSGLFSTPARVRLAITPATDISWTTSKLVRDLGVGLTFHAVDSVLRVVMFALSALAALLLLVRARRPTLVPSLGLALIALAIGGPALWPWYLSWGLVLVATTEPAQRSWLVVSGLVVGAVLVKPGGILALPLESSPVMACLWLALGLALWYRWRRRQRLELARSRGEGLGSAGSVLMQRAVEH